MEDLIKRAKNIQRQKKKNAPEEHNVSSKQFLKFIDIEIPKSKFNALEVVQSTSIDKMGDDAMRDFKNLIELAKAASREQNSEMADLFYELKELKEKEIGIIYNYITKHR